MHDPSQDIQLCCCSHVSETSMLSLSFVLLCKIEIEMVVIYMKTNHDIQVRQLWQEVLQWPKCKVGEDKTKWTGEGQCMFTYWYMSLSQWYSTVVFQNCPSCMCVLWFTTVKVLIYSLFYHISERNTLFGPEE